MGEKWLPIAFILVMGWGGNTAEAMQEEPLELPILIQGEADVPPIIMERGRTIAGRIYRDIGVSLRWLTADSAGPADETVPDEGARRRFLKSLVRVHLITSLESLRGEQLGLAVTRTRTTTIFYRRIEQVCRYRAQDVGAILGHVVAHEIAHLFLPGHGHSPFGLMQRVMDYERAARGALAFSDDQARFLRAAIQSAPQ